VAAIAHFNLTNACHEKGQNTIRKLQSDSVEHHSLSVKNNLDIAHLLSQDYALRPHDLGTVHYICTVLRLACNFQILRMHNAILRLRKFKIVWDIIAAINTHLILCSPSACLCWWRGKALITLSLCNYCPSQ